MSTESGELVSRIYSLSKLKKEYDLIPHIDGPDHKKILEIDDSFALCTCLSGHCLWLSIYQSVLRLHVPPPIEYLTVLLLFVPSFTTFWHRRKQLLLNGQVTLDDELAFTRLVLMRFPRATEPLQHRHWILKRLSSEKLESLAREEIDLCEVLADKHRCNYMVWQHRRWLLQKQLARMNAWNLAHPVDISGWSYRAHLFRLYQGKVDLNTLTSLLLREMVQTHSNIQAVPENDALWDYRRKLMQTFADVEEDVRQILEFDAETHVDPRLRDLTDRELKLYAQVAEPRRIWKSRNPE
ncbi:Protein prenyltransferase alpha subunit repeat-containing protein 1 [Taenia solium]|eukprot:TsM_000237000 transcript=TsM_000237000 gene=TsM_000237000